MKRALVTFVCAALISCGGSYSTDLIPTLPGDGTDNVAKPTEPTATPEPTGSDRWSERGDLVAPTEPTRAVAIELPPIETFKLPNGLEVLYMRVEDTRSAAVRLAVRAGRRAVPRDKIGLASFVAAMLTRGTRSRNGNALKATAEGAGASLSATSSYEASLISCAVPAKGLSTCLSLAADVASAPTFPAKDVGEVREQLLSVAQRQRVDGGALASLWFQDALWGDDHPLGWPVSEASIANISRNDLVAFHRSGYRPNNAFLIVAGPDELAAVKATITQRFGKWARAKTAKSEPGTAPKLSGIKVRLVDRPGPEAHIRVGHFGIEHSSAKFATAMVLNRILGEGRKSRLVGAVKGGRASSSFDRNTDRGAFTAGASSRPEDAVATARTILGEIRRLSEDGPSDAEVQRAVASMVGEYIVGLESTSAVADALVTARLHGFGVDYVKNFALDIGKVTARSARNGARALLSSSDVVVVITGPAEVIEPRLGEAGWKYEKVSAFDPVGAYEKKVAEQGEKEAVAVLDKALDAKGGYEKLSKVRTLQWSGTGTLTLGGESAPVQMTKRYVAPDKLRLDMNVNGGAYVVATIYDGDKGWQHATQGGKAQVVDLPKQEIELGKKQIWRDQEFVLLRYKTKLARVRKVEDRKIGNVADYAIELTSADGSSRVVLLIDKKTHLIMGMDYVEADTEVAERYSNYKKVDGIMIAHERTTDSMALKLKAKVEKAELNVKLDAKLFSKPQQ